MDFTVALLTFGVILLLVGVAGKIQAKELSVGTDSKVSRLIVGLLGAILIAVALSEEGIDLRDPLGKDDVPSTFKGSEVDASDDDTSSMGLLDVSQAEVAVDNPSVTEAEDTTLTASTESNNGDAEAVQQAQAELEKLKAELEAERKKIAKREQEEQQRLAREKSKVIRIVRSRFGIQRAYCDPTEVIKKLCEGRRYCEVKIDNMMCGDPLFGKEKEATIEYFCGDELKKNTTPEEQTAHLRCD